MDAGEGLDLACGRCDWRGSDPEARRCPDCEGQLAPTYDARMIDADAIVDYALDSDASDPDETAADAAWRDRLRPVPAAEAATLGEGATPLLECPTLAEELEVGALAIKDEGHNPTGTLADRALSVAVTVARKTGADRVALPTTGADGVAAAAYAARAGLEAHVFVPTRSTHTTKAMINVHGGDMSVVEGRLPDAEAAFRSAMEEAEEDEVEEEDWTPVDPSNAPLRAVGHAILLPELLADCNGEAPDAIVVPTGSGEVLAGLHAGASLLADLGALDHLPRFHAVQAEGCAPIVRTVDAGDDTVTAWETPDTISGALEVPDPAFGTQALEAIRTSGGSAVAVDDEAILSSACRIAAAEGLEVGVAGGAAAAGAWELSIQGELDSDSSVVLLNTGAGSLDSDVLRSHLMRSG